jgi:hypothetical protein
VVRSILAVAALAVTLVACGGATAPSVPVFASSSATRAMPSIATSPTLAQSAPGPSLPGAPSRSTAARPATPTAVEITRQGCYTGPEGAGLTGTCTTTLTWRKDATIGSEIRVYGVTRCLLLIVGVDTGSCLDAKTVVPESARTLIARAPAEDGKVSWTGPAWLNNVTTDVGRAGYRAVGVDRRGEDLFFAIVVAASSDVDKSDFVIADAGEWCEATKCAGP